MMNNKPTRGGRREGAGRPTTGRTVPVNFRISEDAAAILATSENKSAYIDQLIKSYPPQ